MSALEKLAARLARRQHEAEVLAVTPTVPTPVVGVESTEYRPALGYEITVFTSEALALCSMIRLLQAGRDPSPFLDDLLPIADRLDAQLQNVVSDDQEGY